MDLRSSDRVIEYPEDADLLRAERETDVPAGVLVRDIVRIVEVMNLLRKGFFNKRSVLAGSMALRSYGSPRFTVFDADFSTSRATVNPETRMTELLRYEDDDLTITPSALVPSADGGDMWRSAPIEFTPVFTDLVPGENERQFKADVSFRGLVRDGHEAPLVVPYNLGIWEEPPIVHVMDPAEIVAEKTLGWCVHEQVKHYADLGYIALVSQPGAKRRLVLSRNDVRDAIADKLERMTELQPDHYAAFPTLDSVIRKLKQPPALDQGEWQQLVYIRKFRNTLNQATIKRAVQEILVPLIE